MILAAQLDGLPVGPPQPQGPYRGLHCQSTEGFQRKPEFAGTNASQPRIYYANINSLPDVSMPTTP
jgi:hypothetical protein